MHTLFTILSIFLAVFGFSFVLGGLVGMRRKDHKDNAGLFIADEFLTGGLFTMVGDITANWSRRPVSRRMIYMGLVCNALGIVTFIFA